MYNVAVLDPNLPPNSGNDFQITQNSGGGLTITKYTGTRVQVVIPETIEGIKVTNIGNGAFSPTGESYIRAVDIYSVVIPNTVTGIGAEAFYRQKALSSVNIPNSVTFIGRSAFSDCGLTSLTLGNRVEVINENAFSSNNLTTLSLPASLKKVGHGAFNLNQIESLTIPNGVTELDSLSFSNNPLTTVVIPPSLRDWGINMRAFENVKTITTITLPANIISYDLWEQFGNNLGVFYESQGRKAGTYTWSGRLWSVK